MAISISISEFETYIRVSNLYIRLLDRLQMRTASALRDKLSHKKSNVIDSVVQKLRNNLEGVRMKYLHFYFNVVLNEMNKGIYYGR